MSFKNLKEMFNETVKKYGDKTSHWKRDEKTGAYVPSKTYKEFGYDIDCVGTAFIDMELQDKGIGIIGKNCCEWEESYLAGINGGADYVVPLSTLVTEEQIVYLAHKAKLGALLFTDEIKQKVLNVAEKMPTVEHFICLSGKDHENDVMSFDQILSKGELLLASGDRRYLDVEVDRKKMSLLLFTTGTSGMPKGVMHSHESVCSTMLGSIDALEEHRFTECDRTFSHLPASHIFGQVAEMLLRIEAGASVGYNEGGLKTIAKDLPEFNPTILHGVPAHSELVYGLLNAGFLKKLRIFFVGGAKPNPEIIKKINEYGTMALPGYGLTEYPIAMLNKPNDKKYVSSMGKAIGDLQYRIVDVDGEISEDSNIINHGELQIKGTGLFLGYYEDEDATKIAFTEDGYFHTKDIVSESQDGSCDFKKRVGDRGKNGAGNWMDFLKIETIASNNPYVAESIASVARSEDIPVTLVLRIDMDRVKADFGENINDEKLLELLNTQKIEINNQLPRNEQVGFLEVTYSPLIRTPKGDLQRHINLSGRSKSAD